MKYLHRILQRLALNPDFNFHPKCEKLGIINLYFAGDVVLFVRGDLESVLRMMTQFRNFSVATRLYASPSKSKVYFGHGNMEEKLMIHKEIGFVVGTMPFKYRL